METFRNAFKGIAHVFKNEFNFRIHIIATISVIAAGLIFEINKAEWLSLIIVISMVNASEIFNSAIEYISDFISPNYNEKIRIIKDVAAGAVLLTAIGAFVLACVIFIPKIIDMI